MAMVMITLVATALAVDDHCTVGAAIPHSNRTVSSRCEGVLGEECNYSCNAGYIAVGRHVRLPYKSAWFYPRFE